MFYHHDSPLLLFLSSNKNSAIYSFIRDKDFSLTKTLKIISLNIHSESLLKMHLSTDEKFDGQVVRSVIYTELFLINKTSQINVT